MRSAIRIEAFLLVAWIICITTCAMKLDRVHFKRLFVKRDPSCQEYNFEALNNEDEKKEEMRILFLHEFKLGHNASQTAANINRAWGEASTNDRIVRRWFQKSRSGNEILVDEECRERSCTLDSERLKPIVEQNPRQSVRKMSKAVDVSILTVSDHLKQIGNPCPSFKPFLCKESPKCIPLSSVCDHIPDCDDGYDEDPKVCVASKRPRVEEIYHYLSNEESWIIPKLFDGIDKDVVAAGLATAGNMEDLKIILGLSDKAEKNIRMALMASEEDDPRSMTALGMPDRSWPGTSQLFMNLIETGFEL